MLCSDTLKWHYESLFAAKKDLPQEAVIAPSRNLLSPQAFKQRQQVDDLDERVLQIIQKQGLNFPATQTSALPLFKHCFAASLHFVKRFRNAKDITTVAQSMSVGVDTECARTTWLHERLFEYNNQQVFDDKSEEDFARRLGSAVAKSLGLTISARKELRYPFERVIPYIKNQLPVGEYIIPFETHVLALIKDSQGKIFVFDINQGTVDISTKKGEEWFSRRLKDYKVHLTEELPLYCIEGKEAVDAVETQSIEIEEDGPTLRYEKGEGRWGTAIFIWRGEEHHFPWDSETGYIYNKDSIRVLRIKFSMLSSRNWIDNSMRMIYHAAMAVFKTIAFPIAVVKMKAARQLGEIVHSIGEIFRVAIFTLIGTFVSLYGIVKPLDGRRIYGYLERNLNEQTYRVDIKKRYYIAPCYTPINHGKNHSQEQTIKALKMAVLKEHNFRGNKVAEIFLGWRKALSCFK